MSAAPVVPDIPEEEKVRTWKVIGAVLGVSATTAYRKVQLGLLVIHLEGSEVATPVVYEDHVGFWAPRAYLTQWMRAQQRVALAS